VTINKFYWIKQDLERIRVELPKATKRYDKLTKRIMKKLPVGRVLTEKDEDDMLELMRTSRKILRLSQQRMSAYHARNRVAQDVAKDLIYGPDGVFTLISGRVMYNLGWFATITYVGKTYECRPNDASLLDYMSSSNRSAAEAHENMVTRLVEHMAFNCGIA
jgi:hypothetical protein